MTTCAFSVLAGTSKRADVRDIDGCALGRGGRLVGKLAVGSCAPEVKAADALGLALRAWRAIHCCIHIGIGCLSTLVVLVLSALVEIATSTLTPLTTLNTVKQRATLLAVLESRVDGGGNESGHELGHHLRLLFQHLHELHLVLRAHHVALHSHVPAHLPTTTTHIISSTLHLASSVTTDATISLVSMNTVKRGVISIQIAVNLVQHPPSTASSTAHRFRSGWSVRNSQHCGHKVERINGSENKYLH
jgi:hypothetical protein